MSKSTAIWIDNCGEAKVNDNKIAWHGDGVRVTNTGVAEVAKNDFFSVESVSQLSEIKELLLKNAHKLESELGQKEKDAILSNAEHLPDRDGPSTLDRLVTITTLCSNSVTIWPLIKPIVLRVIAALSQ